MARISVINCSCKVSGRRATYINSRADALPHSPASAHPLPSVLTSSLVDIHIHIPPSPSPHYRPRYAALKDTFYCALRTTCRIRSMQLSRSRHRRKVTLFSRLSPNKRDLPPDYSRPPRLPRLHSPRYENLFIPLPLSFLFSFCDNASTFGFYTSDVVSNFVSLSFRREETHETVALPLRKLVVPPATLPVAPSVAPSLF